MATKNEDGETPLYVAAQELRGHAVKVLIDEGAPMTTRQRLQYLGYKNKPCSYSFATPSVSPDTAMPMPRSFFRDFSLAIIGQLV